MADEIRKAEIDIESKYDSKGTDQAAKAMETLGDAAQKTTAAHNELGEETENVEKRLGGLTNEARETRHAFMELNRLFPGVGDALMGLSGDGSKTLLAVATLAVGVQTTIEAFKSYSKAAQDADEATQILQKGIMLDAVKALADAWNEAAKAEEIYHLGIRGKDSGVSDIEKNADAVKKGFEAQKQLFEQQKALELATINEQENAGVISHKQALAEKLKLDAEYEQARIELEQKAQAAEEAAKQTQIAQLKSLRQNAEAGETRTDQEAQKSEAAARANAARGKEFEIAGKQGEATMEKSGVTPELVEKMREAYEAIYAKGGAGGYAAPGEISLQDMARFFQLNASVPFAGTAAMMGYGVSGSDASDINKAFRNIDGQGLTPANFAAYAGGQGEAAMAQRGQKEAQDKQAELDKRAAVAKLEHEQDQKRIDELNEEIERLQGPGASPTYTKAAPKPDGFVPGTRQTPIQKATEDFSQVGAAGDLIAAGGKLNERPRTDDFRNLSNGNWPRSVHR